MGEAGGSPSRAARPDHADAHPQHPPPPGRPLRILMVSDFFWPATGGVESHIYQLSQCLLARGHRVAVLTRAHGARAGVRRLTNGLVAYYAPRAAPLAGVATVPGLFGSFALLRHIVLRERADVVHAHAAFSPLALEALLHARTMGLPAVFTDHSLFGFADAASILTNKALKLALADAHAVACVSHTSKENTVLRACVPPERVFVVPNAVDAARFAPVGPRAGLPGDDGTITVVVMSRLVYRKGIDLLAAALPAACAAWPRLRFVVGGDGPKRGALEAAVAAAGLGDRVTLVGAVPHPEGVRALLGRGQIFLNCSLTEAFCIALVEAAAAGLVVVSTAVGGVPEVLPPPLLLLAAPSPGGIVEALGRAVARVEAKDTRARAGSAAADRGGAAGEAGAEYASAEAQHAAVAAMYSWRRVAARTEAVYAAALASRRDDSATARARRYARCGRWFGRLCCAVAAVDWLVWRYLEWADPAAGVEPAPDLLPPGAAGGGLGDGSPGENAQGRRLEFCETNNYL